MKKSVIFFEVEGGIDKGPDGRRMDTMPMVEALRKRGWNADAVFYRGRNYDILAKTIPEEYDTFVSRVNPGSIPGGEDKYYRLLGELSKSGMVGMPGPEAMEAFGSKEALVKLRHTDMVPDDTYIYYDSDSFRESFPTVLSSGTRVLKQNRGSTGAGIWRVELLEDPKADPCRAIPCDARVCCSEASDNHVEEHTLGSFMEFCDRYFRGRDQMLLDMPYLKRVSEGELRILFVGETPFYVVHKKPAKGGFSATLFSGANYSYESPVKWGKLVSGFLKHLPELKKLLGGHDTPLIWTADFIPDTNPDGSDRYVLGEMNCSCVGFTSHLNSGIQERVADEIIRKTMEKKG